MSGRGVITSRTSVSPKSTIDCSSLRPSASINPCSAAGSRLGLRRLAGSSSPARGRRRSRSRRGSRISRVSEFVSGRTAARATSNGGSSTSSIRSGLWRTISTGSTCSHTRMKTATKSSSIPIECRPGPAGQDRDEHRRQREDQAEQQPRRQEEPDRILEIEPETIVTAAALHHQAQREPHQRAERSLDGADVDRDDREDEEQQRDHRRSRPPGRLAAIDQAGLQSAAAAEPRLDPLHSAVVVRSLVIVAEKVQQAVQREDAQLGLVGMPGLARLAARDAGRDHEVAESARRTEGAGRAVRRQSTVGDETEDVGRVVLAAVAAIEDAHARVGDERDRQLPRAPHAAPRRRASGRGRHRGRRGRGRR